MCQIMRKILILYIFWDSWIIAALFHLECRSIPRVKIPFLARREPVPRINRIISRSLVAPFIRDRRLLFSSGKTSSFSFNRRDHTRHAVFPCVSRAASFPRGVLIYWPVPLSSPLNATTQNANDTFMNSHAIHGLRNRPRIFLSRASPYCALPRSPYTPIIATSILLCAFALYVE